MNIYNAVTDCCVLQHNHPLPELIYFRLQSGLVLIKFSKMVIPLEVTDIFLCLKPYGT